MNRRKFLAGLGAALATVAATTRLGQSRLPALLSVDIDGDFTTEGLRFKIHERFSTGWTDPRAIYGSCSDLDEVPVVFNGRRYEPAVCFDQTLVDEKKLRAMFTDPDKWYLKS